MSTRRNLRLIPESQRGQTLVGLLLATVIVGVSGAAIMTALGQFNSQANLLDVKTSGLNLATEMSDELSKLTTCAQAMKTTSIQQATDGTYPIAMMVPSLPNVLIQGNNQVLDGYGIRVKAFYIENMRDTGLKGPNNKELFVGAAAIQFTSAIGGAAVMNLRSQPVSQLFMELDGPLVVSCSSNDDPITALAMACSRVSGTFDLAHMSCDMSPLSNQIETQAMADVNQYLDGDYYTLVMANAGQRIQTSATNTLNQGVTTSNRFTNGVEQTLDGSIGTQATAANGFITSVNNTLNQNSLDLWNGINGVNGQTAHAQALTDAANQQSAGADAASHNSLNLSSQANSNVTYANQVANAADAQSQAANQAAGQANQTANSANQVTNAANQTSYAAGQTANAANATSAAANNLSSWANSTSSSANNYATSAYNAASAANNASSAAYAVANASNQQAAAGDSYFNGTINNANGVNWWSDQALGRGYQSYNSYGYTSAPCVIGGPSCAQQN